MTSLIYNVISLVVQASGSSGPPSPSQSKGPQLPIDDHLWVLVLAGIIYGSYLFYKKIRTINKAD